MYQTFTKRPIELIKSLSALTAAATLHDSGSSGFDYWTIHRPQNPRDEDL
jgi:hypothetical protein